MLTQTFPVSGWFASQSNHNAVYIIESFKKRLAWAYDLKNELHDSRAIGVNLAILSSKAD